MVTHYDMVTGETIEFGDPQPTHGDRQMSDRVALLGLLTVHEAVTREAQPNIPPADIAAMPILELLARCE